MLSSFHVPVAHLRVRRWHALPLVTQDSGIGELTRRQARPFAPSSPDLQTGPDRVTVAPRSHPTKEGSRRKYRGFQRMLRCLTIDPAVARPTRDWLASGTFQAVLLIQPAVGTRSGFTAPFRADLSSTRGGIAAAGQPPAGAHAPVYVKCALHGALQIRRGALVPSPPRRIPGGWGRGAARRAPLSGLPVILEAPRLAHTALRLPLGRGLRG
jgi:hypothetical protein